MALEIKTESGNVYYLNPDNYISSLKPRRAWPGAKPQTVRGILISGTPTTGEGMLIRDERGLNWHTSAVVSVRPFVGSVLPTDLPAAVTTGEEEVFVLSRLQARRVRNAMQAAHTLIQSANRARLLRANDLEDLLVEQIAVFDGAL